MRNRYKHTKSRVCVNRKKRSGFMRKLIIYFIITIAVILSSDKISDFKHYAINNAKALYLSPDVKKFKEKTIYSAEEIRDAVAVFKESRNKSDNENQTEEITFRPPYMGEITSVYGEREHPIDKSSSFHTGIDIAGNKGDTVISSAPGIVTKVGYDDVNGHYLTVKHNDKFSTSYAHLSLVSVIEGENIDTNTKIGEIGDSGVSTGAHLHFCIYEDGNTIDPEIYIKLNHSQ